MIVRASSCFPQMKSAAAIASTDESVQGWPASQQQTTKHATAGAGRACRQPLRVLRAPRSAPSLLIK